MMKELFWLVCFLLQLRFAENGTGCCGPTDAVGICSKCCQNYYLLEGICKACPLGFYGDMCRKECVYPWYGNLCLFQCICPEADCHPAIGCQNNDRRIFTQTTVGASVKELRSTVTTPLTTIYGTTVYGTNIKTEVISMAPIVKILGYTLGVSLLIIFGLVGIFIYKKIRENATCKSMNILQQSEQELRLFNASYQQNVDRSVGISRNSINNSTQYQTLSDISHLRIPDNRGRNELVGKSTNSYMEPISREDIDLPTSVDNQTYVDMT